MAEDATAVPAGIPVDQVVTLDRAQFQEDGDLFEAVVGILGSGNAGNVRLTDGAGI